MVREVAVPICVVILKTHKEQLRRKKKELYLLNFCNMRDFSGLQRVEGKEAFIGLLRRKYLPVQKMKVSCYSLLFMKTKTKT